MRIRAFFLPLFLAASAQAATPAATPKRVYRVAMEGSVRSLDPAFAETVSETGIVLNVGEPLLARNPQTGRLEGAAAERYAISENGREITFTLRNDLFWSNGKKITAEDFVYSLRRLIDPSTHSWFGEQLNVIKGAGELSDGAVIDPAEVGIRAKDRRTLVIELRAPSLFAWNLFAESATAPVQKETVERYREGWTKPDRWVGSGPFIPILKTDDVIVLQKNPHHRRAGEIQVDEIRIQRVETAKAGFDLYAGGKVDQFGHRDFPVPSNLLPSIAGRRDLFFQPDLRTYFLRLNSAKAPLSQLKIRQALAMAVDRSLLLSGIGLDGEEPAFSLVPPDVGAYDPPRGYLFSVSGAQRTLKDLGYCAKKLEKSCKSLPFLALIYPESDKKRKVALAIGALFKKNLGLDGLTVAGKGQEEFLRLVGTGDYAFALDDIAVEPDRPFGFLDAFRTGRSSSGGFSNREFDRLLDQAEKTSGWGDARLLLRRAESLLMREGGVIPLFHGTTAVLVSPRVKGYVPNIWDLHPFSEISLSP